MAKFKIRKTKKQDAVEYVNLHNLIWRDAYKNIFPSKVFDLREEKTLVRVNDFAKYNISNKNRLNLVAEADGKIVALMVGLIKSQYDHFGDYAELQALYVHPDFQHQGIASELKSRFEKWAKGLGAEKYVVGVLEQNEKARKVYHHWGGRLSSYKQPCFVQGYEKVERFYTFKI